MNYTALGATINLASRLEGLNKNYGTQVLVSAAVRGRAEHRFAFRSVDQIRPKGFAEAITVYELCGERGDCEQSFCARWEAVYNSIRYAEPAAALLRIADFLAEYPWDGVAQYHAERLRSAVQQPLLDLSEH